MLKTRHLILFSTILIVLSFTNIYAEDLNIAYITMERILEEYELYADESERINEELVEKEAVIQKKLDEYQTQMDELEEKIVNPLTSEEAKQEAYDKYNELMYEAYAYRDQQLANLDSWSQQELQPVYEKIYLKVEEIANNEGYDFVLNESTSLVYVDLSYDITDRVITELNEEYTPTSP